MSTVPTVSSSTVNCVNEDTANAHSVRSVQPVAWHEVAYRRIRLAQSLALHANARGLLHAQAASELCALVRISQSYQCTRAAQHFEAFGVLGQ